MPTEHLVDIVVRGGIEQFSQDPIHIRAGDSVSFQNLSGKSHQVFVTDYPDVGSEVSTDILSDGETSDPIEFPTPTDLPGTSMGCNHPQPDKGYEECGLQGTLIVD